MTTTPDFRTMTHEQFQAWQAGQFPVAAPPAQADPYAVTSWGSQLYDFTVPSGQRCQMKKLRPEELIGSDLLDRITRLPGIVEEQIEKAEGQPPRKSDGVTSDYLRQVLPVLNEIVPLVVVQPRVYATRQEADQAEVPGILVEDIDLMDRIAIMNRATEGVSKMDNFREEPGVSGQRVVDEPINGVSA